MSIKVSKKEWYIKRFSEKNQKRKQRTARRKASPRAKDETKSLAFSIPLFLESIKQRESPPKSTIRPASKGMKRPRAKGKVKKPRESLKKAVVKTRPTKKPMIKGTWAKPFDRKWVKRVHFLNLNHPERLISLLEEEEAILSGKPLEDNKVERAFKGFAEGRSK